MFHFFQKKITRCSKKNLFIILKCKWTLGIISHTLSRAKSNGTNHFVLSLRLGSLCIFRRTPKPYIFYATHFLYGWQKFFIKQNIFSQGVLHVLFRTFFSKMYNKTHWIKSQWPLNPSYLRVGYITPTKHLTQNFTSLVSLTPVSV